MALTKVHNRMVSGAAVNVVDFGAAGDGVTDDTAAIQAAIDSGASLVKVPSGTYLISSTIVVPVGVYIEGAASSRQTFGDPTIFIPSASSTAYYEENGTQSANGFMFFMNVNPASPSTWVVAYPNVGSGGISKVYFNGANGAGGNGIKGAYFGGSYEFIDIRAEYVTTLISAVGEYNDHIKIQRIFGANNRPDTTSYLIKLQCLGDSLIIEDVASGKTAGGDITKVIFLGSITGGHVEGVINGVIDTVNATVEFANLSLFAGYMSIDGGEVTVRKSSFSYNADLEHPITLKASNGAFGARYQTLVSDCAFIKIVNGGTAWQSTDIADIKLESSAIKLNVGRGNHRVIHEAGNLAERQFMGILVEDTSGSIAKWQQYSHFLTEQGTTAMGTFVDITGHTPDYQANFGGFSAAALETFSGSSFQGASDTYYYGIKFVVDPIRLIGRATTGTAEVSLTATNGSNQLPRVEIDYGSISQGCHMLRLYRGTSSGSYDKFVDIPVISLKKLIDNGNAVNGFAWRSRSAGPVDTFNGNGMCGPCQWVGNIIRGYTTTGANTGTWVQGDFLHRLNTTVDGNNMNLFGYKRMTSGSNHVANTDWANMQISTVSPAT